MFYWEKMGQVFNPTDYFETSEMFEFAQAPSMLDFGSFIRIYFTSRPKPDASGQYVSRLLFADFDRQDITKIVRVASNPILPLGGRGEFDEFGTYPASMIREGQKILAYYAGWTRCESVPFNVAIGLAESDLGGESFHRIGCGPVISYSQDEPFIMSGPKIRKFKGLFYLFYIAGRKWKVVSGKPEPVYKIRLAISKDGLSWEKVGKDLIPSLSEQDEAQASPDVFYSNGRYHMFFCFRKSENYRNRENGYRIGYARSDDLLVWERRDDLAGIDVSDTGWDSEMVSYPHVFEVNGDKFMAYLGNGVGRNGFGFARLNGDLE
ncbi:glycosylase [Gammaproteobacteria bacterium]|nr:glycosylase [Gammaproteobacteria bacterium]